MVTKYRPDLEGYVTTNQPGATGDGYTMAERAGAELVQMDQIPNPSDRPSRKPPPSSPKACAAAAPSW